MKPAEVIRLLAMLAIPVIPMGALKLSVLTFDCISKFCGGAGMALAGTLGGVSALGICAAALFLIYLIARPFLTPTTTRHGN